MKNEKFFLVRDLMMFKVTCNSINLYKSLLNCNRNITVLGSNIRLFSTANKNSNKMSNSLEHILFMQLKEDMTEQQYNGLVNHIAKMQENIPGVITINFGKNLCKDRSGGYNYGYRVLLRDPADLQVYDPHPLHAEFKNLLNEVRTSPPIVSDFLVPRQ
ncbi:hypothetical protein PPL_04810 [Heterostelium album PN500]|uniref:Stress-response A/B barrel domain-containing protein n=1 Tax=Heterostelium pallidum (strain ATCC 26659 / Pp 5 / PN500) TaxID=670386 RepID=D3B8L7_HETP5|nr:hypothetical protein PPL_04810 [Heterostelium album PN500]EFA82385.1 hypothetical protein PPL_04810 [Heterostelium album PN500]|eukprot:XP_020434502.1 hypothetical protein PPL_04810 [Heterostelium album PN500]